MKSNEKLFVNVCYADELKAPLPASQQQIEDAINGIDSGYRIPLLLSPTRSDIDKRMRHCLVDYLKAAPSVP